MTETNVKNPRAEIDSIDNEILKLLSRRAAIALEVGAAKSSADASLCDPARESEVISRLIEQNPGPLDSKGVENIFQRVIDESLLLQQKAFHRAGIERTLSGTEFQKQGSNVRVGFLGDR